MRPAVHAFVPLALAIFVSLTAGCGDRKRVGPTPRMPPLPSEPPVLDAPTVEDILERMQAVYMRCSTYVDSGDWDVVLHKGRGPRTRKRPFRTAFERPDRFRFEYADRGDPERRYIIWADGMDVRTWSWAEPEETGEESLDSALGGAAWLDVAGEGIAELLMPDELGPSGLTRIQAAKRLADADVEGHTCFRIRGRRFHRPYEVWIDTTTFLVRRVVERRQGDDYWTEETITIRPVVDAPVDDALLALDPPK